MKMADLVNAYVNALQPSEPQGLDESSIMRGIGYFDAMKPQLNHPDQWLKVRQGMVGLGFPVDWLPESFETPEQMNEFVAHADRINGRIREKLTGGVGGDYPMYRQDQLPGRPVTGGLYVPQGDFQTFVKDSYELGISPPRSASPEDIQEWKARHSAMMEQRNIQNYQKNPTLSGGDRLRPKWGI
jgi:hypothetical protein